MKTIMLGDSLTAWHDWHDAVGSHLNHGIPGDTTDGLLYRLNRSLSAAPDRIILMIGTNDLLQHTPLEIVEHNYTQLLAELIEIDTLYVLSIPPVFDAPYTRSVNDAILKFNTWLREQLWKFGFTYVDLHTEMAGENHAIRPELTVDGVHLSDDGYTLAERLLKKALNETL